MGGTVHGICGNSCPVDSGGEAGEMGHVGCPGANGTYLVFDFISSGMARASPNTGVKECSMNLQGIYPSTLERRCKLSSSSLRAALDRMEHTITMLQTGLPVTDSCIDSNFDAVLHDIPTVLADMAALAQLLQVSYSLNPDFTEKFHSEIRVLENFAQYDKEERQYYVAP